MTQAAASRQQRKNGIRRHGLMGVYLASAPDTNDERELPSTCALDTDLPLHEVSGARFHLGCTGDSCELADGVAVVVAGLPRFKDERWQSIAQSRGPAHAIGAAYSQHGDAVFSHLFGPFCCCIVDPDQGRVLAAIDRLGQHALYYSAAAAGVVLGCQAKAWPQANEPQALTPQGIYNYVYFHMVPSPGSVHAGVSKLPAAHYLDFRDGKVTTRCYWVPKFAQPGSGQPFEELSGELREVLRQSLRNNLPASGKLGAFLSGGLDSSTVTGVMAELCGADAEAYSIGFSAEGYDEMAYARITAEHFGVTLNEYYVTPEDVVDALPLVATSYDEPFGNSSALPAYFCARMAAQRGVDTLLAGDGGDEIFAGNERYIKQNVFERYAMIPKSLRSGLIEPLVGALPAAVPLSSKARSYIEQANTPLPDRLQSYNFLHRHATDEIFTPEFLQHIDEQLPLGLQRDVYQRPDDAGDLDRMLYLDWQFTLADNDLRKVSHMCAVAGVNVTYPMLDDALVEFSCRVPSDLKIKGKDLRHFFKRALCDFLPFETIHKPKQGFGLPFGVWMRTYDPLRELAYDNLSKLKTRGFIQPAFIDSAIRMHQTEHAAYYGELIWILTVFELWFASRNEGTMHYDN